MSDTTLGTVLVLGGRGFLGSHVVKRLLSGGHASKVIVASRTSSASDEAVDDSRLTHIATDITSQHSLHVLFDHFEPHVVIHTVSPPPRSPAAQLDSTIVEGTRNLLDIAKARPNTKAFVYTSSDSACYPSPFEQITEEQCKLYDQTTFSTDYGKAKASADAHVLAANSPALRTVVLRVPLLYGKNDTNYVSQVVASIRKGQHNNQIGSNEKVFEYLNAESAAEAHILAAKALVAGKKDVDGQAYFITDGTPMPFFDFYRKCCAAAGFPVKPEHVKITPLWIVQTIASLGEWMYWVFTLGISTPTMRRKDIDHLDTGCWWNIDKARKLLGDWMVVRQDEAVKEAMQWGILNC